MRIDTPDVDEVESLAELWVDLARDQRAYGSHLHADENRGAIREALARHVVTGGVRVAYDPDPIGFVMFGIESQSLSQDVVQGVVRNIYVRPERRDEGVGTALLDAAEAALAASDAEVITLEAMADNEAARRFYSRRGYTPHRVQLEKRVETDTKERR